MAIFEKEKERPLAGPGTIVGTNVKLTGILKDTNDITIHGKVEGEVISDHNVTISETAEVKGPITAQNVVIAGRVTGSVSAGQKIEILPTGKVYGGITMKDLLIRSGAIFIGKSTMPEAKTKSDEPASKIEPQKSEQKA